MDMRKLLLGLLAGMTAGVGVSYGQVSGNIIPAALVTTTNDSGAGSLRQVTSFLPSGISVIFATNLAGKTIVLTSGPMVLTNSLTIDGSKLTQPVQISGNHNS